MKKHVDYDAHDGVIDLIHLDQLHSITNSALSELPKSVLVSDYKDEDGVELGITEEEAFKFATWEAESLERLGTKVFFAIAFSVFEHAVRKTCDLYLFQAGSPLRWKDINGSSLEKLKIIAGKVGGLQSLFQGDRWGTILLAQDLRHLILHNGGLIPIEQTTKFERYYPHLEFRDYGEARNSRMVEIPSFTVRHVGANYRDFLDDLRKGFKNGSAKPC